MQIDCSCRSVVIILVALCGGCGSSVPDGGVSEASPSPVSASPADRTGNLPSPPISRVPTPINKLDNGGGKAIAAEQAADRSLPSESSIPQSIVNDLSSSEARNRYRALDYWEAKDSRAPLDPVFEALEDEDVTVREKAEGIVERRWREEDSDEG